MSVVVFISHSSRDSALAELLVSLLRSAFRLSAGEIRCTSVDGHRLPAGVETGERLRRDILEAQTMIGILSRNSMASAYVLFELGARWGQGSYLAPVLAPEMTAQDLRGPIATVSALRLESPSQLHQLIEELAAEIALPAENPSSYQPQLEAVVRYCCGNADRDRAEPVPRGDVAAGLKGGDRTRVLRAISRLAGGPWGEPTVNEVADAIEPPDPVVEHALEMLERQGLVAMGSGPLGVKTCALTPAGRRALRETSQRDEA